MKLLPKKIKKNKKLILYYFFYILFVFLSLTSLEIGSKFLPNNKIQSLISISEKLQYKNKEKVGGIVYPYKLVDSIYDNNVDFDSEKIKQINSLFPDYTVFNVYQRYYRNNLYSPITYESENHDLNHCSLLNISQDFEHGTFDFMINVPLLTHNLSKNDLQFPGPNDVLINEDFANVILQKFNFNEFEEIIGKTIDIFSYDQGIKNSQSINVKGVIDSNSDFYKKYKIKFGDFFVSFNHFKINQMPITYFELQNSSENIDFLKQIQRSYNYNTRLRSYSNSNKSYIYEYRILLSMDSELSEQKILSTNPINDNGSIKNDDSYKIYEAYLYNSNWLIVLLFFSISLISILSFLLISKLFYSTLNFKKIHNISIFSIFVLLVPITLILLPKISEILNVGISLSNSNPITFILICLLFVILLIYSLIKKKLLNKIS